MNEMKCIFIIDQLIRFAGTEKHLLELVKYLTKDNFIALIITFEQDKNVADEFNKAGIRIINLNLKKIYGIKALFKFFQLAYMIKSFSPEIVQTFHFKSDTFGVSAAKISGVRNIISSRRDLGDLKSKRQLFLNRLINPMIGSYIAVCNRVKDQLINMESIPSNKITTIYNGIDLDNYKYNYNFEDKAKERIGIKRCKFLVGIACILRPEKDVMLLLEAIYIIRDKIDDLMIIIVGDGGSKEDLINYCKEKELIGNAIFTGYVNDLRNYVRAMDVCCLTPKENEGLSNVILEEMALAKPIIATNVGGNSELVINNVNGFIIEPGDVKSLSKCILSLYYDKKLRNSMGKAGRKIVEQRFTIEKMVNEHKNHYLKLKKLQIDRV